MPQVEGTKIMADQTKTPLFVTGRRKLVLLGLGGLLALVLVAQLSDRTTSRYWNCVYALAQQADAVKNLETPAEAIAALAEIEQQLAQIDGAGVDPRALDATNRLRVALVAARMAIETGQAMLDHPVRSALKSAAAVVSGRSPLRELRDRLAHVRDITVEAHAYAQKAQHELSWRYPLSRFKAPIPPDVHLLEELLDELDRLDAEDRDLRDKAFSLGRLLGALAALLLGG